MTRKTAKAAANILYKLEDIDTVIEKIQEIDEFPTDLYQEVLDVVSNYRKKTEKELEEL